MKYHVFAPMYGSKSIFLLKSLFLLIIIINIKPEIAGFDGTITNVEY